MGTKERQEREREAVRRKILEAATELFVAEGYHNVSMRKIADRIEYSPAALYSYFPSKDDIFFALAEEGFRQLAADVNQPPDNTDPLDALRHGFWQYYQFSRNHPEYFHLMFVDRRVPRISEHWERFAFVQEMMRRAADGIRLCIEARLFPASLDADAAFHVLWAAVHGPATIQLCNRLGPGEEPDALARDTLEAAIAGLRAGSPVTFSAAESECMHPPGLQSGESQS
jgi:AcrR family transcriptional regulator